MVTASSAEPVGALKSGYSAPHGVVHVLLRFVRRQPLGTFCAVILLAMLVIALVAPAVAPFSPVKIDVGGQLELPSGQHLFGTDNLGRDVFSRVLYGARISLYIGFAASALGVALATLLGSVSAYFAGAVDFVLQRFVDAAIAIPALILLIVVIIFLGRSINNIVLVLAFLQMFGTSRIVRGAVIAVRHNDYIDAARTTGASSVRILARHIIPNILPVLIIVWSISIGANILAEASLSFLGYGVKPPDPAWGSMISADGRIYMLENPYLLMFPVLALVSVVFAANILGDALRDELDPRLRTGR